MSLIKKEHWLTEDLPQFLDSRLNAPYVWGENDCALFAADAIKAMTGTDIADDFRGTYSTEAGAWKAVKKITGGNSVIDAAAYCAQKHGLVEYKYPLMSRRGDLVIVQSGQKFISGIVALNGRTVASPGDTGLMFTSISKVVRSWNVADEHEWTPPNPTA